MKNIVTLIIGIFLFVNVFGQKDGGSEFIMHFKGGVGFLGSKNRVSLHLAQPFLQKAFGATYERALKRKTSIAASFSYGKTDFLKQDPINGFPQTSNYNIISVGMRNGTRIGLPAFAGSYSGFNITMISSKNSIIPLLATLNTSSDFTENGITMPYTVTARSIGFEYVIGNAFVVSKQIQIDFSILVGGHLTFQASSNAIASDLAAQTKYGDPYAQPVTLIPVFSDDDPKYTVFDGIYERYSWSAMPRLKINYLF